MHYSFAIPKLIITYQSRYDHQLSQACLCTFLNLNLTIIENTCNTNTLDGDIIYLFLVYIYFKR